MKKIILLFIICFSFFTVHPSFSQWSTYYLPYGGIAYTLDFYNLNTGVSCGHTILGFNEKIFYTTNSGANWIQAAYPPQLRAIATVQFINASTVYACGAINNYVYKTDVFNTTRSTFFNQINKRYRLKGICDNSAENYRGVFIKSTNTGVSWQVVGQLDSLTGYITDMHFFNANTGYAAIDTNPSGYPKLHKTTNAGLNWQYIALIDSNYITEDIYFMDINTGFLCGYLVGLQRSSIYKTTNGGVNWSRNDFLYTEGFVEVNFFNASTGLAVGNSGPNFLGTKIFRTTNAGNSWDSIFAYPNVSPQFVKILTGTSTAFASGFLAYDTMTAFTKTYTFKSTDYGLNWIVKYFNNENLISGCKLIDQNNFFMSGGDLSDKAVILKSTNGGNVLVKNTESSIPSSFFLYQNYPNPFNPTTSIKYCIPVCNSSESWNPVIMKIYNILGKEIATLVNEKQSPGTYEVKFDARNLPSGVYFYKLQSENFIEVKRMVLIK